MRTPTIFGREPAVWVGLIESALTVLLAFGLGLDSETYGYWLALAVALGGAAQAWLTKDTLLSALMGVFKAGLVLVTVYWVSLTEQQTGAILAAAAMFLAVVIRDRTSPVARPLDPSPQQVVVRGNAAITDADAQ